MSQRGTCQVLGIHSFLGKIINVLDTLRGCCCLLLAVVGECDAIWSVKLKKISLIDILVAKGIIT